MTFRWHIAGLTAYMREWVEMLLVILLSSPFSEKKQVSWELLALQSTT